MSAAPNRSRGRSVRRGLVLAAATLLTLALFAAGYLLVRSRDRHPGYALDLRIPMAPARPLEAGFAAVPITPDVPDTWTDLDGDAAWDPDEPWQDGNGNGRFDAVWLAGFHNRRAASGVHDDLWARAMVLGDGRTRVALVALDGIGLMHDSVIDIRARVPAAAGLAYVLVCSTHTHHAPDVQGLWGPRFGQSGVDPAYLERVVAGAAEAVVRAAAAARPAVLRFAELPDAAGLVEDSRLPTVLDPGLRMLQAVDADTGATLGVLVAWANHPETAWRENTLVSSDYPHDLRDALERGVRDGERLVEPGLGGTAVFVNGAIGGLMTTRPGFAVPDPFGGAEHRDAGFAKVHAQGLDLARLALGALRGPDVTTVTEASIALRARTIELPLDNRLFWLAAGLGIVPRGFVRPGVLRSEIAALRIGPASFLAIPGEIYPEIVNGGIETPPGADFPIEPIERPPLRERMPGRFRFVLGLANDAIGYIIPKSEWDDRAPWIYGADEETYGEIVSLGPDTAPRLHRALLELLADLDAEQADDTRAASAAPLGSRRSDAEPRP